MRVDVLRRWPLHPPQGASRLASDGALNDIAFGRPYFALSNVLLVLAEIVLGGRKTFSHLSVYTAQKTATEIDTDVTIWLCGCLSLMGGSTVDVADDNTISFSSPWTLGEWSEMLK